MNSKTSHTKLIAWVIWTTVSIFYAYQYILRVMPNIMINDIMEHFQINAATFGQFSGFYYLGYSLMHLPIGIMLDRYGPKKVMTGCILLTVLGLTPLIFADHWVYPILGRLLIGIGSSAAILGVFKIIRMTFSKEKFPKILSFSVTIGLLGAIYGGGPVAYLQKMLGYQVVVQIFAIAGIVLAALTYWIVPSNQGPSEKTVFSNIKEVICNYRVILTCLFAGLMVGPLEGFADVWGTVFLQQVYGYSGTVAASLPSMIFVGMCFGAPVLSYFAGKVNSYIGTIIASALIMAIGFSSMLFWRLPAEVLSCNFVLVGICCAYQILAIYKASTYVRDEVSGLTTAIANMIIMIFGYAFHSVIGATINLMGGPSATLALIYGTAVIPAALIIAVIGFSYLLLQEKKPVIA